MVRRAPEDKTVTESQPTNKWWVDIGGREKIRTTRPAGPAGMSFFQVAHDFEQERARDRLTDNNLKILAAAAPPEGGWGYVQLAETTYPTRELERVKQLVSLPGYARGVIVDCGRSIRLLITGTPPGDRLLELALGEAPSFDCWVHQEWIREASFDDADAAIRAFRGFIREYLSAECIADHESITARA